MGICRFARSARQCSVETAFTVIENIEQTTPRNSLTAAAAKVPSCSKESWYPILGALSIIILLNLVAFHGSLRGYFLADDFAHVDYLKKVFNGHAHLLALNFYSNWMQTLGTSFYRPFISLTLASDYLIWGANPNGFHISNFIFQTLSSVFLFLSLNCMFPALDGKARFLTAFLAAALFACHPLHPEVVSWIIARVDSVCTTFLFLSLWLYLLSRQSNGMAVHSFQMLSLAAFTLSLMSKEMAITLPPTIFLYELVNSFLSKDETETGSWVNKIKIALIATKWHIALLLIYLGFRTVALGTLFGGYGGSVGDGLKESIWKRWFQEGCLWRLLFPFNDQVTPPGEVLRLVFKLITGGAFALAIARMFKTNRTSPLPFALSPFVFFASGWFLIALAPTVQVFDITGNLQGGRFVYLATAPVVLFLSALIFGSGDPETKKHGNLSLLAALSIGLAVAFTVAYSALAVLNNKPWQEASRGVSNLRANVEKELTGKPANSKIALLNLPPHHNGAHMIYNAAMFGVALKPPLSKEDLTRRVVTFEPVTFGDANLINRTRFKNLLADKDLIGVFVWNSGRQQLMAMKDWRAAALEQSSQSVDMKAGSYNLVDDYDSLHSPIIDVPSTDYDFVDLEVKVEPLKGEVPPSSGSVLCLSWTSATNPIFGPERQIALPLRAGGKYEKYRFSVGELKKWVGEGRITGLRVDTNFKPVKLEIKSARLVNASDEIPSLWVSPECISHTDSNGTIYTIRTLGPLIYDATKIKNAKSVRYEISAPDSWFEHYSGTLRDTGPSEHIADTGILADLKSSNSKISLDALKTPGFYEFRIMALDATGKPIGYVSNPINFQLIGTSFKQKKNQK